MIDFRYHLVSLISVFLALAVGIALGAGPLKETIGNQLTGQVEQLRAEKDALRADLDATTTELEERDTYLDAASDDLIAGILPRSVAVLTLPGTDGATVDAVLERVEQSGATVSARVEVAPNWTDPAQSDFRASLVGNLLGYLDPAPATDADAAAILGSALAQGLTSAKPEDPTALTDNATLVLDVLAQGDLISLTQAPTGPADAFVVIAPAADAADAATPPPAEDVAAVDAAVLALIGALAAEGQGTVVGGPAAQDADVVNLVRGDVDVAGRVATVDTIGEITGQLTVPQALAAAIAGTIGHYGFASSATAVIPPQVDLQPVVVAPVEPVPAEPVG